MKYIADILVIRQLIYCVSLQSIHWENWKHFLNKSKSLKQFCDVMDEENEKSAQNSDDTDYETDEEALGNHFQHLTWGQALKRWKDKNYWFWSPKFCWNIPLKFM